MKSNKLRGEVKNTDQPTVNLHSVLFNKNPCAYFSWREDMSTPIQHPTQAQLEIPGLKTQTGRIRHAAAWIHYLLDIATDHVLSVHNLGDLTDRPHVGT